MERYAKIIKLKLMQENYEGTAQNELIWSKGSSSRDAINMHKENYLKYEHISNNLKTIIKILKENLMTPKTTYENLLKEVIEAEELADNKENVILLKKLIKET